MEYSVDQIDRREVFRYMGCADGKLTEELEQKADQAIAKVLSSARPRYHYAGYQIEEIRDRLLLGKDIKKHLEGCRSCLLFCATLGEEVDRLLRYSQVSDMTKAIMIDAAASAAIEELCDRAQSAIGEEILQKGEALTTRFSCGYGDLPLTLQPEFIRLLDAPRKIGLTVNSSGMLIPTKSVTAVIGILPEGKEQAAGQNHNCASCRLCATCQFRRKGVPCGKK